jgi:hypothetical protein
MGVEYRYRAQKDQIRISTAKGANHDILNFVIMALLILDGGWVFYPVRLFCDLPEARLLKISFRGG